jgi:hypothetical protein
MRFSDRAVAALTAATPLGVALVVAGTALLVWRETGIWLLVPGFLLLIGGVAGAHQRFKPLYGRLGTVAFVLTQLSFLLIAFLGLGFVTLAAAGPLLAYALWQLHPPRKLTAGALVGVWPAVILLTAATTLVFVEAMGLVFSIPYALFAVDALRLPAVGSR